MPCSHLTYLTLDSCREWNDFNDIANDVFQCYPVEVIWVSQIVWRKTTKFSPLIHFIVLLQEQFGSPVKGCYIRKTLVCQLWNSLDVNALIVKTFLSIFVICLQKGIIIHEMGHAIGFQHEQTRPDRNAFVTINSANIQSGVEYNFRQYSTNQVGTFNIPYDYSSVMHYSQYVSNYRNCMKILYDQMNR